MSRRYISGLIYDEAAPYDAWLKYIIIGLPLLLIITGVILIPIDVEGTYAMLGDTVLVGLIFYFVMPRRYQIFEDKIKIVLGGPFKINVPFSTIKELRAAEGYKTMVYSGIRYATTTRSPVEILRKRGRDIVISPADRDRFLEQYRLARQAYLKNTPETN